MFKWLGKNKNQIKSVPLSNVEKSINEVLVKAIGDKVSYTTYASNIVEKRRNELSVKNKNFSPRQRNKLIKDVTKYIKKPNLKKLNKIVNIQKSDIEDIKKLILSKASPWRVFSRVNDPESEWYEENYDDIIEFNVTKDTDLGKKISKSYNEYSKNRKSAADIKEEKLSAIMDKLEL